MPRNNVSADIKRLKGQLQKHRPQQNRITFQPITPRQLMVMTEAELPKLKRLVYRLDRKDSKSSTPGITFRIHTGKSPTLTVDFLKGTVTNVDGAVVSLTSFEEDYR